jgi:hypothetical protein
MRFLIAAIAVVVLGVLGLSSYGAGRSQKMTQGELRCEGPGAVIIKVDGKDYAVNGMCPSSEFLGQRAAPIKGGSGSSG